MSVPLLVYPHSPFNRSISRIRTPPRNVSTIPSSEKYFIIRETTSRAVPRYPAICSCVIRISMLPSRRICSSRNSASLLSIPINKICCIVHITSENVLQSPCNRTPPDRYSPPSPIQKPCSGFGRIVFFPPPE